MKRNRFIPAIMVLSAAITVTPQLHAQDNQSNTLLETGITVEYQPISIEDRVNMGMEGFVGYKANQLEEKLKAPELADPSVEKKVEENLSDLQTEDKGENESTNDSIKRAQEALKNLENYVKQKEELEAKQEELRKKAAALDKIQSSVSSSSNNPNGTTVYNDKVTSSVSDFSSESNLPPVLRSQLSVSSSSAQSVPDELKGTVIEKVLEAAYSQLGVPYVWGGTTPNVGLDCSGFTQYAYKQAGIDIPRVTYDQINFGKSVPLSDLQPGDLLFPADTSHVSMYIGNGNVIHAPQTGDVVKITPAKYMSVTKAVRIV